MQLPEVLKRLQRVGSAQTRKIYLRHGAREPVQGVSLKDLHALHKEIGTDQALASELWRTGIHEARLLAMCVADPREVAAAHLEEWLAAVDHRALFFEFGKLAARCPAGRACAERWIESPHEWVAASGWAVLALLAADPALPDACFEPFLPVLEQRIHASPNFTRYAMNSAVIAIACRPGNHAAGAAAAERIGQVDVDHGPTGCQTPFAPDYIEKVMGHQRRRAGRARAAARPVKPAAKKGSMRAKTKAVPRRAGAKKSVRARPGTAARPAARTAPQPKGRKAAAASSSNRRSLRRVGARR